MKKPWILVIILSVALLAMTCFVGVAGLLMGLPYLQAQREAEARQAATENLLQVESTLNEYRSSTATEQERLDRHVIGSWSVRNEGLLATTDSVLTFRGDGTYVDNQVVDFGWPTGQTAGAIEGTYQVLSDTVLVMRPNARPEVSAVYSRPNDSVLSMTIHGISWQYTKVD